MSERWLWTQKEDIGPTSRLGHAMAYEAAGQRAVLFGGYLSGGVTPTETWEWDGTEWTQIDDTGPPGRGYAAMVFDRERECLVLFGGGVRVGADWQPLGDTWEWGADTRWVKRQDIGPRSMDSPHMVYTAEHTVLVGNPPSKTGAEHTWEWDGRLWTQRQDMGPISRDSTALTYDSQRDRVVLFGGQLSQIGSSFTLLGDTWELAITEQ